ncbi:MULTISPECIES: BlaI/MecI/CopY family transcriptional regulator [Rhodanobacter]|uniref:Putative transcriptional regulator n=1 Tax=Rhodanobacter denitrificans TaxID=666685 RepID=M4NCF5_9GAMM|nr:MULTISPECIES: BlaI/MecI/CopY family transcriptional regulator [Rhodanobacter]AGG88319.1 putative transcriptional regulator [Rhodanobacter denitrificans]KZC19846.1 BlaI/MecI/CopY family transcriptional regulator [Rhodanobacter denitrificans]UJJ52220.1 BlaI/MecI/CopY family transcriptional regulator [Rhodanobacter denitrificans]UJJ59001.1 BlaI/MecI/CopY family transcriptional regulator [Rhodanobacter denitrificans]UJM87461.1 BlaI/MecI/CopY family transcriptional regulator [Rhodanobacter denit
MPDKPIAISEAESRVMELLWQQAPRTSEEIVAALLQPTGWHEKTIRTLLSRLLGKGAVAAERDGRRYLYSPTLTRGQWQSQESRSLLDRVFGGRLSPLLVHFSAHEKLGAKDIAELRKLLDAIEKKDR